MDFVGIDDTEIGDMLMRIGEVFGLDVADLPTVPASVLREPTPADRPAVRALTA
jgi:hypothetical protein